jgi:hypothetical protein
VIVYEDGDREDVSENEMDVIVVGKKKSNSTKGAKDSASKKRTSKKMKYLRKYRNGTEVVKVRDSINVVVPCASCLGPSELFCLFLLKYFNGYGFGKGDVVNFEDDTGLYAVVFEQGTSEHYTEKALEKIITKTVLQQGRNGNRKVVPIPADDDDDDLSMHEGRSRKRKSNVSQPSAIKKPKKETPTKSKKFTQKYDDGTNVSKVSFLQYSVGQQSFCLSIVSL